MGIDLKEILGANYRDDLTLEEINGLLSSDKSMISIAEYNALKEKTNKASSEAANYKKQLNATKTNEELIKQQKDEELQEALKEKNTLQKQLAIIESEKKFIAMGYDEELANKTAVSLAESDMKSFFKHQESFNESQQKKFKSEVLKDTKLPVQTDINKEVYTKEMISKMSVKEQAVFSKEHPDEYKELYGKGE